MTSADSLLEDAGWHPSRRVPIDLARAAISSAGFTTWPQLDEFLASFDGLVVTCKERSRRDPSVFDARTASANVDPDEREVVERAARTRLAPIAELNAMTIFLGEDNSFYGFYSPLYGRLGSDPFDMVSGLLIQSPPRQIQDELS